MNFLRRFMAGRYGSYGVDRLSFALLALYLVLYLVSTLTRWWLLSLLGTAAAFFFLFRLLSRNIPRRQAEEQRFTQLAAPIISWCHSFRMRRADKDHKYFRCPHCRQSLRVPRGQGKIRITCRSCGTTFEEKS